MIERYDILGLGCVAIDDLLYLPSYPPADSKMQVSRRERQCGGLTCTALVAAARLGSQCVYGGTLGDDELSCFILKQMHGEGIDVAHVNLRAGARPIHSTIIVDEGKQTRTILYDLFGVEGAKPDWPSEDVLRSARVLLVDHFGVEGMSRASRIARAAGIPVVADFERDNVEGFSGLLELVDHLILGQDFACRRTETENAAAAAQALWSDARDTVVVTCGDKGCWYVSEQTKTPALMPAFRVPVVDTTGCGDVFHGAYASALARGLDLTDRLRFASAAAALKAGHRGGQAGIPARPAVEQFLKESAS